MKTLKAPSSLSAVLVLGLASLFALSGCGKDVKRTGEPIQAQTQPNAADRPQPLVPTESPSDDGYPAEAEEEETTTGGGRTPEIQTPGRTPKKKGPNQKGPNQGGSVPEEERGEDNRTPAPRPIPRPTGQPTTTPTTRPTSRPSTRPTTRPTGQPTSRPSTRPVETPSASCADPTKVPRNLSRAGYVHLVNGKRGTWQLVDFKAFAFGASVASGQRSTAKVAQSSIQGEALGSVNVWPVCSDLSSMSSGSFSWKMTLPALVASQDGFVSNEVVYEERLVGARSTYEPASTIAVKPPVNCKVITGPGNSSNPCGSWDIYSDDSGKMVLVKTVETVDSRGSALTVRVLARYTWVAGERMLDRVSSVASSPERARRSSHHETDLGTVTTRGQSTSSNRPLENDDWGNDGWENEPADKYPNRGNTPVNDDWNDGWEDEVDSGSDTVVYVGQRPCCCQVLSKRDVRKIRRQVRRSMRGMKACNVRVMRACR